MFHSSAVLEMTELVPRVQIYPHDIQPCQAWVLNYLTHDLMFPAPKLSRSELRDFFTAAHCTLWTHSSVSWDYYLFPLFHHVHSAWSATSGNISSGKVCSTIANSTNKKHTLQIAVNILKGVFSLLHLRTHKFYRAIEWTILIFKDQ